MNNFLPPLPPVPTTPKSVPPIKMAESNAEPIITDKGLQVPDKGLSPLRGNSEQKTATSDLDNNYVAEPVQQKPLATVTNSIINTGKKLWYEELASSIEIGDVIKTRTVENEILVTEIDKAEFYSREYLIFIDQNGNEVRAYTTNNVWKYHSTVSE